MYHKLPLTYTLFGWAHYYLQKKQGSLLWEKERIHIRQANTTVSAILSLGKHCESACSTLGIGLSHTGNMDKAEVSLLGTSGPWGT